ncbi:ribonuclease P protein component [Propionibacteriaceae bacterium G1746]|uniref:ribonuclease P protein component n=1 Tax=Aestuariimicrobium sp. G57 TaxID=3418485 RepID=UPI003C252C27
MLPASSRLKSAAEFRLTIRRGVRAARPTLVVHARLLPPAELAAPGSDSTKNPQDPTPAATAPRVGFVVSKAVGNAVVRNRVKRRLRHLVRPQLEGFPQGVHLVVRALPAAATEPERMADDLAGAIRAAVRRLGEHSPTAAVVS